MILGQTVSLRWYHTLINPNRRMIHQSFAHYPKVKHEYQKYAWLKKGPSCWNKASFFLGSICSFFQGVFAVMHSLRLDSAGTKKIPWLDEAQSPASPLRLGSIFSENKTNKYTLVNWHSNGTWTLWRCISYWEWGYSIAMLVLPEGTKLSLFFVFWIFGFQTYSGYYSLYQI